MIILAAVTCSVMLNIGVHPMECKAYYRHTTSTGAEYVSIESRNVSAYFPLVATCKGEGHPYKVEMRRNGILECTSEDDVIFESGFETGDLSEWD